jgi:UDP-N-acetylglucosamine 1-carboxyvinyltransferase
MDRLVIRGGRRIEGSVQVRGAKNAALPQIAAALLSSERLELANVPDVTDVDTMLALLREFGVTATRDSGRMLVLDARTARNAQAPYDMVRRMRASILVLAPLLARFGTARVSMPGGCAIGARPIDLHLKSLEALGAEVNIEAGYIHAHANSGRLRGGRIVLSSPSVGASETAIMAASIAKGQSKSQRRASRSVRPRLCLMAMGARGRGLTDPGVDKLRQARHELIRPHRGGTMLSRLRSPST